MKLKLFSGAITIASALLMACAQPAATSYTIKGNIDGLPDSTTVQLVPMSHNHEKPIAETIVTNGCFSFEGVAEEPRCMKLSVKDCYGSVTFMLENARIEMNGTAKATTAHDGVQMYDFQVAVTGSPLTARLDSLLAVRDTMNAIHADYTMRYKDLMDAHQQAYREKDEKRMKELQQSEEWQAMSKEENAFFQRLETSYNKLFMDNKDSYWAPLLMIELTDYFDDSMKEIYEQLSPEAKNSYYGQLVKEELYPAGSVGQPVKQFTVKDKDGNEISLSTLLEGKKYLLIDFWASWCGPCRREIPNLKNLYKLYADKGLEIVSISIDKKAEDWEKALKEEQLPWPNFLDEAGVADLYKVKAIPTMYLVDANAVLVGDNLRGEALAEKLNELFQ